jgi:DNA-binding beta-propeller fold protein YncE
MKRILLATSLCLLGALVGHADEPYHFIKEIPIGGDGGWDYLTVDPSAERLYVSHATKVVVVDLNTDQVVGEITNTIGVHGIAVASKLKRAFVSDGRANQVTIADADTLQTIATAAAGNNPDCIILGPKQKEVYAFNGRDHTATVIATDSGKVVATIPLGGKPEFAQTEPKANRVFDNLEDQSEVAVIDAESHQVVTNWPIAPGESASGMAVDRKDHRLFLGCDNQMMVMMDSASGKVLANVPIGTGVDANAFDPKTKLAFASCGDGTTTIAHEDGDTLTVVQTLKTERGARTMALDPTTHKIYLATAKMEAPEPGQRRGKIIPGTFKILVYGMN